MKKAILILSFFSIFSVSPLEAQNSALVHTSQPFYVSGEVIWYKLYLPEDFPAGPKVITVSLFDRSGNLMDQSYLRRAEEAAVHGFYKIPYEWTSGIYRLVFIATEENRHQPVTLAETFVPIYDDFSEEAEVVSESGNAPPEYPIESLDLGDLKVKISTDRVRYAPRALAEVRVKVTTPDGAPVQGTLSISVGDEQLFKTDHPLFSTVKAGLNPMDFPELEEDITLQGTIFDPGGQSILPRGNIGAFLVNQQQFVYAKADEEARFTLDLPAVYGSNPIHVGGFLPEDLVIRLHQQVNLLKPTPRALPYPPEVLQYLEWSRRRKLIYQLYGQLEHTFSARFPSVNKDIEEADRPIILDEYSAFPDIPTLVKDLLIPIRFRTGKDKTYEARIFDPTASNRKFHTKGPLFIVDGQLTRDADFIARLDIPKIERLDLYFDFKKGLRLFGPMARSGLVMIQSRNRDIEVPEPDRKNFFTITGFQAEVDYPIQIETAKENEVLLRPALFWAPDVKTDDQGEAKLSIPLSDDHSRFRVEVVAQGLNGGRGRGETFVEVRK